MAEAHHRLPEGIREAVQGKREKPGAGLGSADTKQVSGLERRKSWTHWLIKVCRYIGSSRWDRSVQFHTLTRGLCKQQHLPHQGSCCSVLMHTLSTVSLCSLDFFSLLHVCNISSWLKKLFSFCGNTKAVHYSALIPHGWRSMASLKSFPAVCNINSCTKMKLISFSEILLLTLNKVRGMGRNSSNNSLYSILEGNYTSGTRTKPHRPLLPSPPGHAKGSGVTGPCRSALNLKLLNTCKAQPGPLCKGHS